MARVKMNPNRELYGYVRCRTLGHSWDAVGPLPGRRPRISFGTLVTLRCEHCAMLRFDVVSRPTGQLLYRFYEQPSDYSHEKLKRDDWRAMMVDEMDGQLKIELTDDE